MRLPNLPTEFRETANVLRRDGAAEGAACAWERAAEEVEEAIRESMMELLTLDEAARESGYSKCNLRRMLGRKVPNSGTKTDPRIQRADLPKKPGFRVRWSSKKTVSSRTQVARVIAQGGE